ncbi:MULTISPECIES: hemerythrin domain-containing protein [unclassified Sphingomonas]|uniref:hemerythrin domain-containing protein n=1 Tax=unclassified Sphingomonas TaxID=196159 RepID=UPI000A4FA23B|nr:MULTISPECIES: hemerythrin domain-containing protein [unclassified Sphingomonas]
MSDLATRGAIGDDLAYLRATYPQPDWRTHANFGQLADFWLHIHASLRAEAAAVETSLAGFRDGRLDAPAFQRRFVPDLNRFLQHLNAHHQIEDSAYFPKFRALDPRMARGFDLLDADHHAIHDALDRNVAGARTLLAALGGSGAVDRAAADYAGRSRTLLTMLDRHLADEEDLVIPAMLEHGERRVT